MEMDTKSMIRVDVNGSSSLLSAIDVSSQRNTALKSMPYNHGTIHDSDDQTLKAKSEDVKVILVYILIVVNVFFSVFNAALIYWVVNTISLTLLGESSKIDIQGSDGKIIIHGQIVFTDNLSSPSLRAKVIDDSNTATAQRHRLVLSSRSNITISLNESLHNRLRQTESRRSAITTRSTSRRNDAHEPLQHVESSQLQSYYHPIVSLVQESIVINSSSVSVKHPDNKESSISMGKHGISIRSPHLTVTDKRGLDAGHLTFMTHQVSSNDTDDGIVFHSPTRALKMISPQTMSLRSGQSMLVKSTEQLSIVSTDGSIILDASLIDTRYLDTTTASKTGSTYSGIHQVCQCVLKASANQRQIEELDVDLRASLMAKKGAIFAINPRLKCNDFDWYCSSV